MTLEEIRNNREVVKRYGEILSIFKEIYKKRNYYSNTHYLEYIKLAIGLGTNKPTFHEDYDKIAGNCYTYALDLYGSHSIFPSPAIYVGFLSGYKGDILSGKELLERFYADCDTLGIKAYDSSIRSENVHGGYKLAIYFGKHTEYGDLDFHFLRENSDGSWSERAGYDGKVKLYEGEPKLKLDREFSYEMIKVVEIVKPIIRERKLN